MTGKVVVAFRDVDLASDRDFEGVTVVDLRDTVDWPLGESEAVVTGAVDPDDRRVVRSPDVVKVPSEDVVDDSRSVVAIVVKGRVLGKEDAT